MQSDNEYPAGEWLPQFPALAGITDAAWIEALHSASVNKIPKGTVLFRPGDPCMNFVLILAGTVRVYIPSESGREIVLYRLDPGDICVLTLSNLLGGVTYSAEGITESEAKLVAIPPLQFEHALTASPAFRRFIFSMIGQRLGEIMLLLEEITFKRMDVRLAQLLSRAAEENDSRPIQKTHQVLAAELGSTREVISRLLKEFERNGWVRLDRGQIHVVSFTEMKQFSART